jgi:hypothetical protein
MHQHIRNRGLENEKRMYPTAPVPRVIRRTGIEGSFLKRVRDFVLSARATEPSMRTNGKPRCVNRDAMMCNVFFQNEKMMLFATFRLAATI